MYVGSGKIKRSFVLDEIRKILLKDKNLYLEDIAEEILAKLESLGMRPTVEDGHGRDYRFKIIVEWEPEDETK